MLVILNKPPDKRMPNDIAFLFDLTKEVQFFAQYQEINSNENDVLRQCCRYMTIEQFP
jgi:hypothetical protein